MPGPSVFPSGEPGVSGEFLGVAGRLSGTVSPFRAEQGPVRLTWEIPWTEEPGGLQSCGHKESDREEFQRALPERLVGPRHASQQCCPTSGL